MQDTASACPRGGVSGGSSLRTDVHYQPPSRAPFARLEVDRVLADLAANGKGSPRYLVNAPTMLTTPR